MIIDEIMKMNISKSKRSVGSPVRDVTFFQGGQLDLPVCDMTLFNQGGQLDPPVRDVTFFNQGGLLRPCVGGVTFLDHS